MENWKRRIQYKVTLDSKHFFTVQLCIYRDPEPPTCIKDSGSFSLQPQLYPAKQTQVNVGGQAAATDVVLGSLILAQQLGNQMKSLTGRSPHVGPAKAVQRRRQPSSHLAS